MNVDDTAKAIVAEGQRNPQANWVTSRCEPMTIADLQAMAKLWLRVQEVDRQWREHQPKDHYEIIRSIMEIARPEDKDGPAEPPFEYEYLFESEPGDTIQIDGWMPVATERIRGTIEYLIGKGKLRRIEPKPNP